MAETIAMIIRVLRSRKFFAAILLLFLIESVWFAVTAPYPMVPGDYTPLNVIQLYAHHWSPFFSTHATYMDSTGAVSRDPSFLYRWLMSFPYRAVSLFSHARSAHVIVLRLVDILLFVSSLVLMRRLLVRTWVSEAIINVALLLFILTPIVPLMAGQINYGNLLMLVTVGALLLATGIEERLRRERLLPVARTTALLTLCLFGSLVQELFLPIFLVIALWIVWLAVRAQRGQSRPFMVHLKQRWEAANWQRKVILLVPLFIALGMFVDMYGVNVVRYHHLTPHCTQVLSQHLCATNDAWVHRQAELANKPLNVVNPGSYAASWTYRMFVSLFYAPGTGARTGDIGVRALPLLLVALLGVVSFGVVLTVKYRRDILRNREYLGFLLFASLFYVAVLLLRNYHRYAVLGVSDAVRSRALWPVIPLFVIVLGLAFQQFYKRRMRLRTARRHVSHS